MSGYTENSLVEQPAVALFAELGWETANCFYESFQASPSPFILFQRERRSGVAGGAINVAVEELTNEDIV